MLKSTEKCTEILFRIFTSYYRKKITDQCRQVNVKMMADVLTIARGLSEISTLTTGLSYIAQ